MSIAQIVLRHGTSTEWLAANPVLAEAELGVDVTLSRFKLGDGVTRWDLLPWQSTSLETLNDTLTLIDTRLAEAQAAATTATEQAAVAAQAAATLSTAFSTTDAAVAALAGDTQTQTRQTIDSVVSAAVANSGGGTGSVTLVEDPNDPGTYLVGSGTVPPGGGGGGTGGGTATTVGTDTDGNPYFDVAGISGGGTIAVDTDGAYYYDSTGSGAGVTLLDTDGNPYVSGV